MTLDSIRYDLVAFALLAVIVVGIGWLLVKRDKSTRSAINLEELLIGPDGKMSKAACVMFGAFVVTTWMMVYLTLSEKMSEGYLSIYVAAWIAPTLAWILKGPAPTDKGSLTDTPPDGKLPQ